MGSNEFGLIKFFKVLFFLKVNGYDDDDEFF